jgi:hypothetical protein
MHAWHEIWYFIAASFPYLELSKRHIFRLYQSFLTWSPYTSINERARQEKIFNNKCLTRELHARFT